MANVFCAVVEQQLKNAVAISLFWVAFLLWRLIRLQVACAKALESAGARWKSETKCRKVWRNIRASSK